MSGRDLNILVIAAMILTGIYLVNEVSGGLDSLLQLPGKLLTEAEDAIGGAVSDIWTYGEDAGDAGGASIGDPTF